MKAPEFQRARNAEAKEQRRAVILRAAEKLFDAGELESVTMSQLATQSGLAKGTLYLYFATKEAVFLELLVEALDEWSTDVGLQLLASKRSVEASLPGILAETLVARPRLIRLLGHLHSALERNVDEATITAFKHKLLELVSGPAEAVEAAVPRMKKGDGVRFFLRVHSYVVGLAQTAIPAPHVAKVLEAKALQPLQMEFRRELEDGVAAWLRGW